MAIRIRVAETEADLEAWRRVRRAVLPDESVRDGGVDAQRR